MKEPEKDPARPSSPEESDPANPPTDLHADTLQVGSLSVLMGLQSDLKTTPGVWLREEGGTGDDVPRGGDPALKYQVDSVIGKGGMGTVFKAFDSDLHRWVAMKVVHKKKANSKEHLSRFVEEAQVCGQLEHPNIAPVHEMGVDPDGQVFFTMKLVRGRTLHDIARDLSIGRPEVRREFTPIRIAQVVQQAAMGVHYANVRGVIHRDLKPENIMVGDYGEVLVMDWGLAKVSGEESSAYLFGEDSVVTTRTESGIHTVAGVVQGTPSFMAPEQARGDHSAIDDRTDVFGLGAVLYALLCFQPLYRGKNVEEILGLARSGLPAPPSRLAPRRTIVPPDLEAICMKALSTNPEERYTNARGFQQGLQSYIEGTRDRERRRTQALALVRKGGKKIAAYRELEKKRKNLKQEALTSAEGVAPHESVEKKRPLWAVEDQVDRLEEEASRLFSSGRATLDAAIQTDPGCREARKALTELHWDRFQLAEDRRDTQDAALHRALVEAYDDGTYATRLQGDGSLRLTTNPPGAEVTIFKYVEEDRVLVPRDPRNLGKTPLGPTPLPMGSYLVVLKLEGYQDTLYPVFITRTESHQGDVDLFTEREVGSDFVYVPAGEFIRGGDSECLGGFERSRIALENYFIARFPVTMGEYCDFLDVLAEGGEELKDHLPQQAGEVFVDVGPNGRYSPREVVVVGETRKRYPPGFEKACPVLAVSWNSAMAFIRWRSERDGRQYELPPEDAWAKGARGVDGRFHSWGDRFDWTFAKGGLSRPERAQPEPVGIFSADQSPFGVRDMVGTIREWTQSWFDERAGTRVVRGGSWNLVGARGFRCANRLGFLASSRTSTVGFRLMSWKPQSGSHEA